MTTVAGMGAALASAGDDDWIVVQHSSDTPDAPRAVPAVPDIATWLLCRGAPVGAVGRRGLQFDRRSGRLVPLGEQDLSGPVTVDAIDVDDLMIVRVAAARAVGGEVGDVDFCLRLQRAGYGIYVDGTAAPRTRPRAHPRPRRRRPESDRAPAPLRLDAPRPHRERGARRPRPHPSPRRLAHPPHPT